MEKIQSVIGFLKGKKTYFTVAIGVLYLAGAGLGFWEVDWKFLAGIGFLSLAFVRAGLQKVGINIPTGVPLMLLMGMIGVMGIMGSGCASAPTAVERHFFNITTNYIPAVVTNQVSITNEVIAWKTNVVAGVVTVFSETNRYVASMPVAVTNYSEMYDFKPNTAAGSVASVGGAVGSLWGVGGLVGGALTGLFGLWGRMRSRKTAAALMQIIETGSSLMETTPQGAALAAQWKQWMITHQAETGTIAEVTNLMGQAVDSDSAKAVADKLLKLMGSVAGKA